MGLKRIKLGDLLEYSKEKNLNSLYGVKDARGVDNKKKIIITKADVGDRDFTKFYIVKPGYFFFNHRTSRHGDKFCITYNYEDKPFIVTEDYDVFKIKDTNKLSIEWLYLYFNRPEFDRFVMINSWGSSTEFYSWDDLCNLVIDLPDIEIQKKYVEVYFSMVKNQESYEKGLDDIQLSMQLFFDRIKNEKKELIGNLIKLKSNKNSDFSIPFSQLRGINEFGEFTATRDSIGEEDIDKYLIIEHKSFAVNFMCLGNFGKFYLAYNDFNEPYLVSPACNNFSLSRNDIDPYYFMFVLQRSEFQRKCVFLGDGNTRGGINISDFSNIEIPLPSFDKQMIISELYRAYENRRKINEVLKNQIKVICPILIKGSIEEARGGKICQN